MVFDDDVVLDDDVVHDDDVVLDDDVVKLYIAIQSTQSIPKLFIYFSQLLNF